jgi:hypothetical protein
MRRGVALAIMCTVFSCALFAQGVQHSHLKNRIPVAYTKSYQSVLDARDWKNPYLIVRRDGIEVRTTGAEKTGPTMPVERVIAFLEKLPKTAWPYGLVVGVQENGVRSGDDDAFIKHNSSELLNQLRNNSVKADLWPSA